MWDMINYVLDETADLKAVNADERGWRKLVDYILENFGEEESPGFMTKDVTGIELTKSLYKDLQHSKIDYALMFKRRAPEFKEQMLALPVNIPLSAFSNLEIESTITVLGVEVKSASGRSFADAENQIAVWAARTGAVYLNWVEESKKRKNPGSGQNPEPGQSPKSGQNPEPGQNQELEQNPKSGQNPGPRHNLGSGENSASISSKIKPIIGVTVLGSYWSYHIAYLSPDHEYTVRLLFYYLAAPVWRFTFSFWF